MVVNPLAATSDGFCAGTLCNSPPQPAELHWEHHLPVEALQICGDRIFPNGHKSMTLEQALQRWGLQCSSSAGTESITDSQEKGRNSEKKDRTSWPPGPRSERSWDTAKGYEGH
eukprot:6087255-Amphidinium_carterae.1